MKHCIAQGSMEQGDELISHMKGKKGDGSQEKERHSPASRVLHQEVNEEVLIHTSCALHSSHHLQEQVLLSCFSAHLISLLIGLYEFKNNFNLVRCMQILESLTGIALSELEGWAFHGEIDEIESPETVPRGCKHLSFIIKTASALLQSTSIYLLTFSIFLSFVQLLIGNCILLC